MAIVDKYVTPSGSSANTGDSWANAWDLPTGIANLTAGMRLNILAGNYLLSSSLASSAVGSSTDPVCIVGWKADKSGIVEDWSDCPILNFQSSGMFQIYGQDYYIVHGLKIANTSSYGLWADQRSIISKVWVDNCGGEGISVGAYSKIIGCRATNCSGHGIHLGGTGASAILCEAWGNNGYGIYGALAGDILLCFARNNGAGATQYGGIYSPSYCVSALNTIDGEYRGIDIFGYTNAFIGNLITNCQEGIFCYNNDLWLAFLNNLFGNTTDINPNGYDEFLNEANMAYDPKYVDIANNDYKIQEANLMNVQPLSPKDNDGLNVGAWQSSAAGAGGGGGGKPGKYFARPLGVKGGFK